MVFWLRQKANIQELIGSSPSRHHILNECYVDSFTRHNPPATHEWRVIHSRWVWKFKKFLYKKNLFYFLKPGGCKWWARKLAPLFETWEAFSSDRQEPVLESDGGAMVKTEWPSLALAALESSQLSEEAEPSQTISSLAKIYFKK